METFYPLLETRRQFLLRTGNGIGAAALSTMLNPALIGSAMGEGMQPRVSKYSSYNKSYNRK